MSGDILNEFGPDSPSDQKPRAINGGDMPVKSLPYSPPKGPTNMMHKGPGLADATNHGCCGTQGKH